MTCVSSGVKQQRCCDSLEMLARKDHKPYRTVRLDPESYPHVCIARHKVRHENCTSNEMCLVFVSNMPPASSSLILRLERDALSRVE